MEKLVIGPINKGLKTDRTPFMIDDDSFPVLINAYQWRGRIKRKRGTSLLGRLERFFNSTSASYSSTSSINLVAGAANILTGFSLESNGNIVPGSVTITDVTAGQIYTDLAMDGTLTGNLGGTGTINYATGAITITGGAGHTITVQFLYFPDLPVMGLEDLVLPTQEFPGTLAFDTVYSYNINTASPYNIYDVSFFKNPPTGTYPGYVQKTNDAQALWNGQDYQQFWTVNYEGALWATNGITVPFTTTNIGMQFKAITNVSAIVAGPPATAQLTIVGHNLVVGDFVFINEVAGVTGINFQTGYVITVVNANNVVVEFPNATLGGAYAGGGIAQYLTSRAANPTLDGIRFYDGDPTDGNATSPTLIPGHGWVNFAPPLSHAAFSIGDLPADKYYLVGARMIIPFKDRLLFLGVVVQSSSAGPFYLQDVVVYSQNGTPYYTSSFTGDETLVTTTFHPILVPANETATASAYYSDITGFGGFVRAGIDSPITTASPNGDVLIVGFESLQSRFVYTGNDIVPFNFFGIDVEYGSSSTFTAINTDKAVLTRGSRGYIATSQVEAARIDIEIPDQVFEVRLLDNGVERMTAYRDFINEWIYFSYPSNTDDSEANYFNDLTLQYNYRDNSWAVFTETYTHYGTFRRRTGNTWATIGNIFPTWRSWNESWDAGSTALLQPQVIGGNQQGFVVFRDDGTNESSSLYIQSFSASIITSPSHGLNEGDYITISGAIGTISSQVNGKIFSVGQTTKDTFSITPNISTGTYSGGGGITRMYTPFIQTKQFPTAWGISRKTRIGAQQYLLTATANSQIQLLLFLSQNADSPYNNSPIVPATNVTNSGLIYTTTLYTCPESTNLGLTPANSNLMTPTAVQQEQIWHRVNISLIGDTIQLGFTMSDAQMRDSNFTNQFAEIELHAIILNVESSQLLV